MTKSRKTSFGKTTDSDGGSTVKSADVLIFDFIKKWKTHQVKYF